MMPNFIKRHKFNGSEKNNEKFKALFSLIKSCETYDDMTYEEFISTEIYTGSMSRYPMGSLLDVSYIIAGVKRISKDDLGISDLPYHCNSNDIVNYIPFVHVYDPSNIFTSEKLNLFKNLMMSMLIDKNDTHTIISKDMCQQFDDIYFSNLKILPLKFEELDDKYFIRQPITQ